MKKIAAAALTTMMLCSSAFAMDINDKLSISGTVEVEAGYTDDGTKKTDDISLATAEVAIDGTLRDGVSGHILYAWDDEASEFSVDEAYIALEKNNLFMNAGKQVVPFGRLETEMISDPLALEIAEIHETAVTAGWADSGFTVYGYALNGSLEEKGEDDKSRVFGGGAEYEKEGLFRVGVQYINRLPEADSFRDHLNGKTLLDIPGGVAAHAEATMGPVLVRAEGVKSLDDVKIEGGADVSELAVYGVEAVYGTELLGRETTFAAGYQWTDDAEFMELAETRIQALVRTDLGDGLALAAEYAHDTNYGSAKDADSLTLQLGLEF